MIIIPFVQLEKVNIFCFLHKGVAQKLSLPCPLEYQTLNGHKSVNFWARDFSFSGAALPGGQAGHLPSQFLRYQRQNIPQICKYRATCMYLLLMLSKFEVLSTQFSQDCAAPAIQRKLRFSTIWTIVVDSYWKIPIFLEMYAFNNNRFFCQQ